MFIGEFHHNIDDKSRLAIPAKFRDAFREGAVVTRGLDTCLFLYAKAEWETLAEQFANLPLAQADTRAFARFMLAGAMALEVDTQGRILLPDYLKNYAGISRNVVIAGLYRRLELWDAARWSAYTAKTEASANEIAERLSGLGV